MFTFNDGHEHGSVQVYGDLTHWEPLDLFQVGRSTQYACGASTILALMHVANGASQYKFKVDDEWVLVPGLPTVRDSDGNENQLYDPDEMTVEKRLWKEADTPYLHHSPSKPSDLLLYIVPGNPGLSEFYEAFIGALSRLVPGAEIVAPSHRGFNLDEKDTQMFTLDQQVNEKVEFLKWFRETHVPHVRRVALLGHSVGSWISQRIAVRSPDIVFVGMLMPTVRSIALSERGQKFTTITRYVGAATASWYVWSLGWVPFSKWILRRFIDKAMPAATVPAYARETSLRLMQNSAVVKQIVSLAIEEMQRIGPEDEPEDIRGFWDNTPHVWSLFAAYDHWVSPSTREELIKLAETKPNVSTIVVDGLRHAFCIRESNEVAGLAAYALTTSLGI